jgi:hypothetical protein
MHTEAFPISMPPPIVYADELITSPVVCGDYDTLDQAGYSGVLYVPQRLCRSLLLGPSHPTSVPAQSEPLGLCAFWWLSQRYSR